MGLVSVRSEGMVEMEQVVPWEAGRSSFLVLTFLCFKVEADEGCHSAFINGTSRSRAPSPSVSQTEQAGGANGADHGSLGRRREIQLRHGFMIGVIVDITLPRSRSRRALRPGENQEIQNKSSPGVGMRNRK